MDTQSIESIFAEASAYIQNLGKDTVLEGRSELQSPIPSLPELNSSRRHEGAAVEHTVVVSIPSVERGRSYFHNTTPLRSFAQATGTDCGERLFKDAGCYLDTSFEKTQPYQVFPEHGVHALGLDCKMDDELVDVNGQHALVAASHCAFCDHVDLTLDISAIAGVIGAGLATHINQHSERLRSALVDFDGKKTLTVIDDTLVTYSQGNNWMTVFQSFSDQIKDNIGVEHWNRFQLDYSTSTEIDRVAGNITVMSATQKFFDFRVETRCGIPAIHLKGSPEDWEVLMARVRDILELDAELSWWVEPLSAFLEMCLETSRVDGGEMPSHLVEFWNSWYKYNTMSGGATITGTINVLFPYIFNYEKTLVQNPSVDWRESAVNSWKAPASDSYPCSLSSAPVVWDYLGVERPLHVSAGLMGVAYHTEGGFRPLSGYAITEQDKPATSQLKN